LPICYTVFADSPGSAPTGLMKRVEAAATRIANHHGAEITDTFFDFLD
jgi:hypothetical protein